MLNYTVPPFQFLVGTFDATHYLDSISLSVPMHEIGQALLWTGQFRVSFNRLARTVGLTEADFSERNTPTRWRPYQQQVRLNIRGYQSPVFRIENYRYNPQTRTGEGRITQIPTAVAGDRPGVAIPTVIGGSISAAIDRLIQEAFIGSTINPSLSIAGDGGILDVPLTSRSPWEDAVRLSGLNWKWLAVNGSEAIYSVDPSGSGVVFTRTPQQAEVVPDLSAIYQDAYKVLVTGARQVPGNAIAPQNALPQAPRPKVKTTTENRPIGTIFPSLAPDATPVVFEQKTIVYQYFDDRVWTSYLPTFGSALTAFIFDIETESQSGIVSGGQAPPDLNVALQTITFKMHPIGFVFPSLGANSTLIPAEVLIESNLRKLTLKPLGVLFPDLSTDSRLAVEKRETLTSTAIPPGAQLTIPGSIVYEARPKLEPPQPIPSRPLKTEVLKGEAALTPSGWTPILPTKPLVIDLGFLPDASRASFLAQRIAAREQYRREQFLVDMPIPNEWLAAGWPLLARCQIGNDLLMMDGCAISIEDGTAKFGFAGALVASNGNATFTYTVVDDPNVDPIEASIEGFDGTTIVPVHGYDGTTIENVDGYIPPVEGFDGANTQPVEGYDGTDTAIIEGI